MTPPFLAGGLLSSAWQSNFSLQIPFGKIPSRQDSLASQDVLPLIDSETSRAGQRKWIAVKRQIDDESSGIHVLRNLDSVYLSAVWLWIHVYKTSHILLDLNMETIAIFVIKKWGLFQICSLKLLKTRWKCTQEQDRTNLLQLPIENLACGCE